MCNWNSWNKKIKTVQNNRYASMPRGKHSKLDLLSHPRWRKLVACALSIE